VKYVFVAASNKAVWLVQFPFLMMPTLIFLQYDKQMQMAVMNLTNKHSQFPQTAE